MSWWERAVREGWVTASEAEAMQDLDPTEEVRVQMHTSDVGETYVVDGSSYGFGPGSRVRTYRVHRPRHSPREHDAHVHATVNPPPKPPPLLPAPSPLPDPLQWTITRLDQGGPTR